MKTKLLLLLLLANFSIYAQVNLVSNGGFENWTNSTTPSNWTVENNVKRNTLNYFRGFNSITLSTFSNSLPKITNQVPLKAGITYTIKFKYKYSSPDFEEYTSPIVSLKISNNGTTKEYSDNKVIANTDWLTYEGSFTPDQDLSYDFTISLTNYLKSGFLVAIDEVMVYVQGTEEYTYIPDRYFELRLRERGVETGDLDGLVLTYWINTLTSLDVEPELPTVIQDLTGIEDFTALTSLNCSRNNLTNLDLSKNTALTKLNCSYNNLTTLDLSAQSGITSLACNGNKITSLDLSKQTGLNYISCFNNSLTYLNIKNGNNTAIFWNGTDPGSFVGNPNLTCILVDDPIYWNKKWMKKKNGAATYSLTCDGKYTAIPDLNFEKKLIDLNIDAGQPDGKVLTSTISSLTTLDVSASSITDLKGIEDFISLTNLNCRSNQITALDVSNNLALTFLECSDNKLTVLDVSKNLSLNYLNCKLNQLTTLDVSKNTTLTNIYCNSNKLTALNLKNGKNTNLLAIDLTNNPSLTCIQVDDAAYSTTNWANLKDATAKFNLDCRPFTLIPDPNFEDKLILLNIDKDGKNGKVVTEDIVSITTLDISNSSIADLTGIQDFAALTTLNCSTNSLTTLDISANKKLSVLNCNTNQITALNLDNNVALTDVNVAYNLITSLSIAKNPALIKIDFSNNALNTLNLKNGFNTNLDWFSVNFTKNPSLSCIQVDNATYSNDNWNGKLDKTSYFTEDCNTFTLIPDSNFEQKLIDLKIDIDGKNGKVLTASISKVTDLNVQLSKINDLTGIEDFTALEYLNCQFNNLSSLNVSKNLKLIELYTHGNNLTALDLTANLELTTLQANKNQITNLDISKNTKLVYINVSENKLRALNLKNGNNTILHFLNATNNPNLSCIQVDNVVYANANWITSKDTKASYNLDCTPYTLIPDSNFEQKLINSGIDTDGLNGKVLTNNISTVKFLDLTKSNISDLTGIQDFVSLTDLYCGQNSLTTLNVSKNTNLTTLDCNNNKITSLDVSNNIALLNLSCYANQLTELDVKVNTALTKLDSGSNKYTVLDVSSNTALTFLGCNTSQLTSLDISKNTALNLLDCRENKLTHLDVSKITTLTELYCQSNQLTNLDISKNKALEFLNCSKNQLTTLDVSVNTALVGLYSNSNQLTSLNLKNANNVKLAYLNLKDNPNLSCIQVDDSNYFNTNWADKKDKNASYDTNCTSYVQIPDSNFEQKLIDLGIDTDGLNGKISIADASSITSLDVSNSNIKNLSGIENFTSLTYLDCSNNQLTNLDVTHNVLLETLNASSNQLTSLDLSKNSKLTIVYVVSNPLVFLNLQNGNNKNMIILNVTGKKEGNNLTTTFLGLNKLSCVKVDNASFANANWSKIKESTTIYSSTCSLGLEDSIFDKVVVYPNPTKGEVTISNVTLEKANIYNTLGQLVRSFTLDSGNTSNTINLSGLPRGVYYVYLINQDAASAKKVIVE